MHKYFERYFPVCRPFFHRLKRWTALQNYRNVTVDNAYALPVVRYFIPAGKYQVSGKKLAFLSDMHFFGKKKDRALMAKVRQTLKSLQPDYLLLGGDQSGNAENLDALTGELKRLTASAPVTIAINGNWESGKNWLPQGFWKDFYRQCGIIHLCNETFSDGSFCFTGVDDISHGKTRLPELPQGNCCNILLAHSPDAVIALDHKDMLSPFTLALCGHTHGGQVRLPFFGPGCCRSKYLNHFIYGLFKHERNDLLMVVTSGISEGSFPLRLFCRREIVFIEFV